MKIKRLFSIFLALLIFWPMIGFGQISPSLGTAGNFGVYTAAGAISNINTTLIKGDLGNDAGAITGFSPSMYRYLYQGNSITHLANKDVYALFAYLGGLTCTKTFTSGNVLTPGVYCIDAAASLHGSVTLNGGANDIFVLNIGGVLNTAVDFRVVLTGGAVASNVYWRVLGAVNIGANATFVGTLVAQGAVSIGNGSTLSGSILVTAGAINLDGNRIINTKNMMGTLFFENKTSASISGVSGLSNAFLAAFNIIQNPVVNSQMRLNMPNAGNVTVYNNLGQVLLNKTVEAGTQAITLPTLAKGIYHVRCGTDVKKFVVQ